ncbi:MAG: amino acid adenylation domain-containing protein [Pseudomonadota bacterium]
MDRKVNHAPYGPLVLSSESVFIHKRIAEQTRKNPDAIACVCGEQKLTYEELDLRSNRVSELVKESIVHPHTLVGVTMSRSSKVVEALLGIMKSGCAYVPLDPAYPEERLMDILEDTRAPAVCVDSNLSSLFASSSVKTISLDSETTSFHTISSDSGQVMDNPMAYVIYTSGSTGKPKGVCCLHNGVTNLLSDFQNRQPLGPGDICSWWTSLNFDVSVYEIFAPLVYGACLIVTPDSVRTSGPDLMDWLYEKRVTSAYIPPFMVADLAKWVQKNPGRSKLKRLLVGVEPIRERTLLSIHDMVPGLVIINGYGPTETTICATLYSISPDNIVHENTPIGRPVQNTYVRVLNEQRTEVEPGTQGELFIGGIGLAAGYLNRPELTAERFVKDPFSDNPDARMYKTGDTVLILDDGNLEFLGRTDEQVKLRGFRIELGEIETQLRKIRGVREAVVILRDDGTGGSLLVAYMVIDEGHSLSLELIRDHLKKYLPDYMIPSAFVRLDRVPATPNGKTDKRALPGPDKDNIIQSGLLGSLGPISPIESKLTSLFEEVLKIDSLGIESNFFTMGGHSLLAVQLVSRIRDTFGVNVALSDVFQAPTPADLAKLIQSSAPETPDSDLGKITPGVGLEENGLSFSQMRLWYLDQLEPGTPAYNICLAYKLVGPLDAVSLNKSLAEIVNRHQSLRTVFEKRGSDTAQVISEPKSFAVRFEDLHHIPASGRETEARMLCLQESQRGFDLFKGPLFRCLLLRLDLDQHVLMFTMNHIISDGWSTGIIIRELMDLYSGFASGAPVQLTPLQVQYTDYVRAQKEWMLSDPIKNQLNYWRQRFLTLPEPLNLPIDKPRPAIQSYRGASESMIIDKYLCAKIRALAAKNGATLFMLLLAGFKALLYRYTQQDDVCVGTFVANRSRKELESIVGFFINTVAIRTRLDGETSFDALLAKVRENTLGAYANQDVPFEKILEAINPERSLARTPVFQVMMVLQNMPLPPLELPGIDCLPIELETFRSNFDVTCWVYEEKDRLKIVLDYSTDLFEDTTIQRLLKHFSNLLSEACENSYLRISEVDFIGNDETATLLNSFSGKSRRFIPPDCSVTCMFEGQVSAAPEAIALIDWDDDSRSQKETTYSELNNNANMIAKVLYERGASAETNVAIMAHRSRQLIFGIMGILKAGASFLPIDPNHPVERVSFMLDDASSLLLLTDSANLPKIKTIMDKKFLPNLREVICLDTDIGNAQSLDLANNAGADMKQAAYAIYTSGSSGQPKGVMVEHGALASFTQSAIDLYGLGPQDRVLQFASPAFDASIEEIFPSLASGASLALRSESMLRSIPYFLTACKDLGITVLDLPTAFWSQLVASVQRGEASLPESLRIVIIGGEQASYETVMTWFNIVGEDIRLFNTYGPTEATVVATAIELGEQTSLLSVKKLVPIGKPLPHVRTYVLDHNLKPTPIGIQGELFIGGAALARGYINLTERTHENFIPDPYGERAHDRLYKTGDRARYNKDGILEFLGRADRQIKIRGFRVELEEIESALSGFDEIQQAIVVPWEDAPNAWRLNAFLVPNPSATIESDELRRKLTLELPDFMIPSTFAILEKLPITSTGKIDTQALIASAYSFAEAPAPMVPPRNPVEKILTEIWSEVFGRDSVGVRDNFFDLGGHSLLSLQIIDKVNRAGLYLTPAQFIQNPTIEEQAQVMTTARPSSMDGTWSSLVELQPYGSQPPLYFVHSTPGDVLGYVNVINKLGADQPCFGFQSLGLRDATKTHRTVEEMASFYVDEMFEFQPDPPYCLVGWCYGGILAAEMAVQMTDRGRDAALLVLIETPFPRMKKGRARYFLSRSLNLIGMGPKGWALYIRNKIAYRKKVKRGAIDKLFSLELDQGPLANRSSVYRENMKAISLYRMKDVPSCPVRLFRGEELEEGYIPDVEELWLRTCPDARLYSAPGNHLTILKEPGSTVVVQRLKECLQEISRKQNTD